MKGMKDATEAQAPTMLANAVPAAEVRTPCAPPGAEIGMCSMQQHAAVENAAQAQSVDIDVHGQVTSAATGIKGQTLSAAMDVEGQAPSAAAGAEAHTPVVANDVKGPTPAAAASQVDSNLALAMLQLRYSKAGNALQLLEQLLLKQPHSTQLLHLRGQCLEQLGNTPGAYATYMSALIVEPQHVETLMAAGSLLKSRGLLTEALQFYLKALAAKPDDQAIKEAVATVLTDLGTQLKLQGKVQEGRVKYEQAIEVCPAYAPAYYNMGVVLSEAGKAEEALEHYRQAVARQPGYGQAHCNMGVIYKEQGKLEKAIACYADALAAAPNYTIVASNMAIVLTDKGTKAKNEGRLDEAIALYHKALAHSPYYPDAMYNLGVAYTEKGKLDEALHMYQLAVHFAPHCAEAHNNMGVIFKQLDNLERAVECYMAALQVRPSFPQSLNNLGVVYTAQGRAGEALALLNAAILACPTYAEAYNNLGVLQRDVGAVEDALASYSKCLELCHNSRNAGQNRLLALNYIHSGEEELVCQAHAEWGDNFLTTVEQMPPLDAANWPAAEGRALRVGYISPDLFTHSVSYFAEAPLTHHNPASVQHIIYNCTPKADAKTAYLKSGVEASGGVWKDVTHLAEKDLAQMVHDDRIDILVELTGHTANNRLGVMAMRPAPVQVTWIGYPNSTGLRTVDYRFTDAVCDPDDTTQTFVEELVRLPGCFLCYTASKDAPDVAELPALSNGFVTFGSFNSLAKITTQVLRLWAGVLNAVPGSRLMLKNKPFACEQAKAHCMSVLVAEGIDPQRVDLLPLQAGNSQHLGMYGLMDISLDPFPYAGTTTTTESLWMGVPCVTLAGRCHAQNVGMSLLTALQLQDDWVAHSEEEYVQLAVRHASNLKALAELRLGLRERMACSMLCNAPGFVSQLEGMYHGLFQHWWSNRDLLDSPDTPCPATPDVEDSFGLSA